MRTKAFGNDNIIHLGTYYQSEELGEEKKLEMEEYLKGLDSKKFKEFMEWKEEMERKFPLHWKVKEYSKKASIFNNILTKIKDKFAFLFDRDCFT